MTLREKITEIQNGKTVDFWMTDHGTHLFLDKIIVKPELRGQGRGTAGMNTLCAYADEIAKPIRLAVYQLHGGRTVAELQTFYEGFGFVADGVNEAGFLEMERP